jgi:RHS repeat-associated protein
MGAFSYNSRLQPLQMFYGTNSPPSLTGSTCPSTVGNILHRVYSFNVGTSDNGDVISIANCRDTNRTQSFTYDSLNRIKTAATQGATCTACWGQMFGYMSGSTFVPGIDAWGNLFQITATQGSTTTLTQTVSNNNQFVGMTYDAAGNLINDGAGHTYTFDDENRLTATAGYTYVYDGDGKRVKKCSNSGCTSGTIYWTGTGSDAISEAGVAGSITEEYIFFNSRRVARRDASGGAVHYYFSDHLGSASVVTDNSGNIQKESDYYPFGGEVVVTGSDINNYKFTGKERDAESGLDMFGARYNSSSLGRFMTPDWATRPTAVPYAHYGNPQSLNLYSYVQNNPTTVGDPDGHCPDDSACSNVKVTVTAPDPSLQVNVKTGGNYVTGGGTIATVTFTSNGQPMTGMSVTESPKVTDNLRLETGNGTANPGSETTNAQGSIKDTFIKPLASTSEPGNFSDKEQAAMKSDLNSKPYSDTKDQTLTFTTKDASGKTCTCQATYSETLSNIAPPNGTGNGSLNQPNSNGVNYVYTPPKDVVVKQKPD